MARGHSSSRSFIQVVSFRRQPAFFSRSSWAPTRSAARTQPFDFPATVDNSWTDAEVLLADDVDGDGRLDLVSAGAGGVAWWRESLGVYTKTTIDAGAAAQSLALGDLDADGDLDLAFTTTSNLSCAWPGAAPPAPRGPSARCRPRSRGPTWRWATSTATASST